MPNRLITLFSELVTPDAATTTATTNTAPTPIPNSVIFLLVALGALAAVAIAVIVAKLRKAKKYERGLKMVPLLIHLPPQTDDINSENGRDKRDIANEAISKAQVMYSILFSTITKGLKSKVYGQRHFSLEIIARDNRIRYYAIVPAVLTETVAQAIQSAYPTARIEEKREENIFKGGAGLEAFAGAELSLNKEGYFPIATYEETKRDGQMAILNALSTVSHGEGAAVQILFRPAQKKWSTKAKKYMENVHKGKSTSGFAGVVGNFALDVIRAPWEPPEAHEKEERNPVTNVKQNELEAITNKLRYPAFETLIRIVASSSSSARSEAIVGGLVSAFSQFNSPELNGFRADYFRASKSHFLDYTLRSFDVRNRSNILNSVELATIFHLPEQNAIPNSQVERQLTKQVDGPSQLATEGLLLGTNEFRGVKKAIYLSQNDRRRHMYVIGQTGMGKSVFLENLAFQDMCDGLGFAFIDPHGDAVEALLKRVPEERIDDVIYFDPADIEHPVGMNMFEFTDPDQKDFIVQEGISMLQSLFDPNNQGFFGARGQHMFRNAALLLMADPAGATFIDIPQCFTDPEFVKSKLKYVTDKAVYDYWTKEFPESQKSSEGGDIITWFSSKWGPFLSNTIMRNTLGQIKSGFNIREIMDNHKIFLVNLSKGRLGDINANLLGMIFVMKFQQAAMSRQDIPEHERQDFCLYVDEFQNFATESFESILSEARKYRLNLIVANQFMTQLTDKIREALLGNVGTIICGRVGVTDADLMVKAFSPTFTAEDLTKTPNYSAVAKVMMYDMPSAPFTMSLPPSMGQPNEELMESLKAYSATKYAKSRKEVEKEIAARWDSARQSKPSAKTPAAAGKDAKPAPAASADTAPKTAPASKAASDRSRPASGLSAASQSNSHSSPEPSQAVSGARSAPSAPSAHSGPSAPSKASQGPHSANSSAGAPKSQHHSFLEQWLASQPKSTPTPVPAPTSAAPTPVPAAPAPFTPVTPPPVSPVAKPTPVTVPVPSTPTPEPQNADLNEIDDTDDAPPPPESEGISLQVPVPEPDSTPEDEVVFRIR